MRADGLALAQAGQAAGRIAAISSCSVYCDAQGHTLDEASGTDFPAFAVPLTEQSPVLLPGPQTYSTRKRAMEEALLAEACCPVTILRPCAIHGPQSKHAREWWFVKRLLDGRKAIPLAYRGESRFQTTSTVAIADAVAKAAAGHLATIVNVADADSPPVAEIARAIMAVMGVSAELIGLPDAPTYPPRLGMTPWSIPRPMICPAGAGLSYADAVEPAVRWLIDEVARDEGWRAQIPQLAAYPWDQFDYAVDDEALELPGGVRLAA